MYKKILILAVILVLSIGAYAMSITDIGKLCVFSEISGVITHNGEPITNAKLVRKGDVAGSGKTDETITDENGHFRFPALYVRSITKYLPQEFVARQDLHVHHDGEIYEIWHGVKRQPEENVEARGEALDVTCDLSKEIENVRVDGSVFFTRCSWNVEPDPEVTWDEDNLFEPGTEDEEIEYFDPNNRVK